MTKGHVSARHQVQRTGNTTAIATAITAGPMPAAAEFAAYEAAHPGTAAALLKMATDAQAHNHSMEAQVVGRAVADARDASLRRYMGQVFGFITGLTAMGLSALLASHGYSGAAIAIPVSSAVALATAFIAQRSRQSDPQLPPPPARD